MRRAIIFALLLVFPAVLHARVIKWEGKPISVSISTERLTRIEFPETLRSVFLSRSDIAVEKEDRSLYVRALAPEVEDTLFVVGESGTTYEINLSTSDNPDQTVVISHIPKSLQAQAERAGQVPALDLMRSMMRGLPVDGYEIIKADKKEVYRDAFFSMKLVEAYRSPVLHGYVIEVENLAEFPVLVESPGDRLCRHGRHFRRRRISTTSSEKSQRSSPGEIPNPPLHRRCANNESSLRSNQPCLFWKS